MNWPGQRAFQDDYKLGMSSRHSASSTIDFELCL
jgi:hypothetical protein